MGGDDRRNKKWDVVTQVPVRRVPKHNVILGSHVGDGDLAGRKFQIVLGADGDIRVGFERAPGEPEGEVSFDRFVVRLPDVMDAIGAVVAGKPVARSVAIGSVEVENTTSADFTDVRLARQARELADEEARKLLVGILAQCKALERATRILMRGDLWKHPGDERDACISTADSASEQMGREIKRLSRALDCDMEEEG